MCDKEIEVIDLTLCESSDEEEDLVKNLKASCSSTVLISSDIEDSESAFEYVQAKNTTATTASGSTGPHRPLVGTLYIKCKY